MSENELMLKAVEGCAEFLETFENLPPGEIKVTFCNGHIFTTRFQHISEEEWKKIDEQRKKGLWGWLFG